MTDRAVAMFSPYVAEKLGFYVYALRDPADHRIFYVGKGKGNRVFSHARAAVRALGDVPNAKFERIRAIRSSGEEVEVEIIRHGLTEREALEIEAVLIELLGLDELLTNLVKGYGKERGRMSAPDVVALYGAKPAPTFPKSLRAVLLRIPVLWYPSMPADELYRATRGWWVAGSRINNAEYAFAVNRGVIRETYQVLSWGLASEGDSDNPADVGRRWGFVGVIAKNSSVQRFRNTDVSAMFARGSANPVRYVNC